MTQKLALVIGGTSGLGRAISLALSEDHSLAISYRDNHIKADALLKEIQGRRGTKPNIFSHPLKTSNDVPLLFEAIRAQYGRGPDIMVYGVGGKYERGLLVQRDKESLRRIIEEGLLFFIEACQEALPSMYARGWGRIIALGSAFSSHPVKGHPSDYVAANAGIEGFVRSLALEVASRGITANVVAPGIVDTPSMSTFLSQIKTANHGKLPRKFFPTGKTVEADDIGQLVRYLCSDVARSITGTVIEVDGASRFCGG